MPDTPKLLAEWFWTDRWMGSSGFLLPMEARGLYREMLTQSWRRGGSLPADHDSIMRATGCTKEEFDRCWPLVKPFWASIEGGAALYNVTQKEVMDEALERRARLSTRARTAANARWEGARGNAQAPAQAKPKVCPPSPSPSPSPKEVSGSFQEPSPPAKPGASSKKVKRERVKTADINTVLTRYRHHHPLARPGPKDRELVAARLKDGFSIQDLASAIDGCHRSPFHSGENSNGSKYQSLRLILRNSDKVRQFMEVPKLTPSEGLQRSVRVGENWLAMEEHNDENRRA